MPALTLESVTKTFRRGIRAVDRLSLEVADGEMLVLAGPSGCGKTTTLRLVAGLERPTEGVVRIGGRVMNRVAPGKRNVAMVFQNYALYPHMTVRRNLEFGAKMRRVPRDVIARRLTETADRLGLMGMLDRKPASLSGGEQQRVALGRVLVRQPACALFDEPLSNLDPSRRRQLRSDIRRMRATARTTSIYVTHDQEDAMALGGRLAVMNEGRIAQVGAPLDVYREPANRFVAGFLGDPPMNFIEGRVRRAGDVTVFTDAAGLTVPAPPRLDEDASVVLGVRPEDVHVGEGDLRLEVTDVALLGAVADVTGRAGTAEIVARCRDAGGARTGQRTAIGLDPKRLHWFEPGPNGARL